MAFCLILLVCCVGCHRAQFWNQRNFVCICFHLVLAILRHHNIGYHIYADDTQLYTSFKCKDALESLTKLNMYISDIRVWMMKNKLKINNFKTKFIIFRSPLLEKNLSDLSVSVGYMQVSPSSKVRDLGDIFNPYLTFHDHISGICKSTHFHCHCTTYSCLNH